ncbi:MAG: DNA polymerase III subunit beta [Polyangiales bacterium]
MELTIDKENFLRGLARTHAVADRKSSMHILSNVLLSTEGENKLRINATDLYLGVTCLVKAKVKSAGSIAASARTLFEIVKNLPAGDVQWKLTDSHSCEIRCGKVRYKIPTMPGDDFPPLPNPGDADFKSVGAEALSELVSLTQYSMSHDDTRPHLAGTLLEGDGKVIRMVTTDGHRLSKAEQKLKGDASLKFNMLVPHKGISELKRLLDDSKAAGSKEESSSVEIANVGGNAFFRSGDRCLSVKLAEEQFPPYNKVIPHSQSRRVVAARHTLVEALKRISLVANDKSGGVQLLLESGVLRLQSQNPEVGEGSEEIDVDYAGDSLRIGFNARYILDALNALPNDEVAIELSGELDPGVIKPVGGNTDFVGVIMPMRI